MPQPHWPRAWKRATWLRRLSGLTLPRSTLEHGAASFIASLRAIPASPTALLESGSVPTMTAGLQNTLSASSTKAGLVVSSERTSPATPMVSSPTSSLHWKILVAALRSEFLARKKSARAMGGNGFLLSQTDLWQTPATDSFRSRGGARKNEMGLDQQARTWRLPQADMTLVGEESSAETPSLNPRFVEWLMGWPIGWTASAHAATGLSHWLLLMRGELSRLCSPKTPAQASLW